MSGRSDSLGRAGGRMAELWGVVGRVKAQKEAGQLFGSGDGGGWAVVDPAAFEEIKNVCLAVSFFLTFLSLRCSSRASARRAGAIDQMTWIANLSPGALLSDSRQ